VRRLEKRGGRGPARRRGRDEEAEEGVWGALRRGLGGVVLGVAAAGHAVLRRRRGEVMVRLVAWARKA
jgi:hypothetical protein